MRAIIVGIKASRMVVSPELRRPPVLCEILSIEAWRSTQENPISGTTMTPTGEHTMSLIQIEKAIYTARAELRYFGGAHLLHSCAHTWASLPENGSHTPM